MPGSIKAEYRPCEHCKRRTPQVLIARKWNCTTCKKETT